MSNNPSIGAEQPAQAGRLMDDYLDTDELADQLNVSPRSIARWRALKEGPAITRIGNKIWYRRSTVEAWLLENEVQVA